MSTMRQSHASADPVHDDRGLRRSGGADMWSRSPAPPPEGAGDARAGRAGVVLALMLLAAAIAVVLVILA